MNPISIHGRKGKVLRKNRKGGIEGLPLQLMIIIMIATLGTAILVGWMGNIEEPHSIKEVDVLSGDIDLTGTNASSSYGKYGAAGYGTNYLVDEEITVLVLDQNGDPLSDATVVLSGLGISDLDGKTAHSTTDSNGVATFSALKLKMTGHVGYIDVEVSKSGYGENTSCKITVIA